MIAAANAAQADMLSNIGIRPYFAIPGANERAGVFDVYQSLPNGQSADTSNVFSIAAGSPGGSSGLPVIDLFGGSVLQTAQGSLYGDMLFVEFTDPTSTPADIADILSKAYIVKAVGSSSVWRMAKFADISTFKQIVRSDNSAAAVNRGQVHDPYAGARKVVEGAASFNFTTDRLYLGFLSALSLTASVPIRWGFARALVCNTSSLFHQPVDSNQCAAGLTPAAESAKANLLADSAVGDRQ